MSGFAPPPNYRRAANRVEQIQSKSFAAGHEEGQQEIVAWLRLIHGEPLEFADGDPCDGKRLFTAESIANMIEAGEHLIDTAFD